MVVPVEVKQVQVGRVFFQHFLRSLHHLIERALSGSSAFHPGHCTELRGLGYAACNLGTCAQGGCSASRHAARTATHRHHRNQRVRCGCKGCRIEDQLLDRCYRALVLRVREPTLYRLLLFALVRARVGRVLRRLVGKRFCEPGVRYAIVRIGSAHRRKIAASRINVTIHCVGQHRTSQRGHATTHFRELERCRASRDVVQRRALVQRIDALGNGVQPCSAHSHQAIR